MSVRSERRGPAFVITVDRPAAKNAISGEVARELVDALDRAGADDEVHAAIIASALPDVFLAGGDIQELSTLPYDDEGAAAVIETGLSMSAIESCPVPVIAAVDGAVFGGGCELLMMCDLVVMGRGASLRFVHAKMGLVPAWGGCTRLIERVGGTRAADLLLTARKVGAEEAGRMGLASRMVPAGEALQNCLALADDLGTFSREAVCAMKTTLVGAKTARRGAALEHERGAFTSAWGSPAHRDAFTAFLARKKAKS